MDQSLLRYSISRLLMISIALTVLHLILALLVQEPTSLLKRYNRLFDWDSVHYRDIAENGYRSTVPRDAVPSTPEEGRQLIAGTNVAFLPGYPLLIRAVHATTRTPWHTSALLASQGMTIVFWLYLLLFLRHLHISPSIQRMATALIFAYPSAFFLMTAYAESLALAAMMGFLYWSSRSERYAWLLAALHGFVMIGTRLTAFPLLLFPLLSVLFSTTSHTKHRNILRAILIGILASMSAVLFFLYCQYTFGHWNLYFLRQAWGWGVQFDPLFFLKDPLQIFLAAGEARDLDPYRLSRISSSLLFWLIAASFLGEWILTKYRNSFLRRLPLYVSATGLWIICASSTLPQQMQSMLRYTLPVFILLILAWANLLQEHTPPLHRPMEKSIVIGLVLLLTIVQILMIRHFTGGYFVA